MINIRPASNGWILGSTDIATFVETVTVYNAIDVCEMFIHLCKLVHVDCKELAKDILDTEMTDED